MSKFLLDNSSFSAPLLIIIAQSLRQQPVQFQVDCGPSANILPLEYAEGEELDSCL